MAIEKKKFKFEVKSQDLQEDGTFVGLASTYGNVDQGNDVVVKGAFTKTLQERGDEVPILWSHDSRQPVGLGTLEDSATGLVIKGKLNLETQIGRDVYSNIKARIVKGLSIGFQTLNKKMVEGIRHLTELKLEEVSLCLFPMNEQAEVYGVKATGQKAMDMAQSCAAMCRICADTCYSVMDYCYRAGGDMADEDHMATLSDCIACCYLCVSAISRGSQSLAEICALCELLCQRCAAACAMFPDDSVMMACSESCSSCADSCGAMASVSAGAMEEMSRATREGKAGRKLSAATRKRISDAMQTLQTLLAEAAGDSTSSDGAVAADAQAKAKANEPNWVHSLADRYTKSFTGASV